MRKIPTTTALLSRLQVFEPTRRPTKKGQRKHSTPWGDSTITGRLGQRHADVLELILFLAINSGKSPGGSVLLLVDEYQVRTGLGRGYECSWSQLGVWLGELTNAWVELLPTGWETPVCGRLIERVGTSVKTVPALGRLTSKGQKAGARNLKVVELGQVMSTLIAKDIPFFHDPHPIVDCRAGFAQALVRHVKTHKNIPRSGWKLNDLIDKFGVKGKANVLNKRRELTESEEYLRDFGISIRNDRVFVHKNAAE